MATVTVLMPAFNAENFIEESLNSVLDQTYGEWLLYVLDDASTDRTNEIVKEYVENDSRIILVENKKNLGISKTRNKLLKLVKTEFVAWLDSDDIALSNRLLDQVNFLKKNVGIFGLGGSRIVIDEVGKELSSYRNYEIESDPDYIRLKVVSENPFCNSTMTFRNQSFTIDDNFPPAEDFEFWSRLILLADKRIINKSEFYVKYRKHSNNSSNKNQVKQLRLNDKIVSRNLNVLGINSSVKTNYYLHHYLNPLSDITNPLKYALHHVIWKLRIIKKLKIKRISIIAVYLLLALRNMLISFAYKTFK